MATEVVMPQMGESIAEGTITRWLVKVGDKVERDQPLFEISTDKVDAEIPSPAAGTLLEIRNQEGETVPVNQVVATIGEAGEQSAAGAAPGAGAAAAAAPAVPAATPGAEPQPTPTEVEREETAREGAPAPQAASPEPQPRPAAPPAQATVAEEKEEVQRDAGESAQAQEIEAGEAGFEDRLRKFSSPLVRSIAAKEGVNLEEVQGTGTHGRVTKDDILGYLDQRKAAPAPAPTPARPAAPAAPAPAPAPAAAPAAAAPPAGQRPLPAGFHVPAYTAGENVEIEPMAEDRQTPA